MRIKSEPQKNIVASLIAQGLVLHQQGKFKEAQVFYGKVLAIQPNHFDALQLLGILSAQTKQYVKAVDFLNKALQINPNHTACYSNRGVALQELKRLDDALESYEKAISVDSDYAEAHYNRGVVLKELKRLDDALESYDNAINVQPNYAEAYSNRGNVLKELKRLDEALESYEKAISIKPDYAEAHSNKGNTLLELKRLDEAIAHFDKAISIKPDYAEAYSNKGNTLLELKRLDEAIAHFDKALSLKPDYAVGWSNKGAALNSLRSHAESAKCYQKALEFNVGDSYLLGQAHHQMMLGCDWTNYEKNINRIFDLVDEGRMGSEPFGFQGIASSEALLKKSAEIYSNNKFPALGNLSKFSQYKHHKIRIGYLCGEFRDQATSILMTRVWELHDKSKFEIFAFDSGWDDGSEYRQRIEKAFTNIFDISKTPDFDVVRLIQENEIDILVNLNGFFGKARQQVFSYKPAPIQVNYLGFPGTIGINYIDYIIADKVVVPEESKLYYVEKLAYLPNSYQANDDQRKISDKQFSRVQLGIPENSFVFACFNKNYKITPATFDSWMRILFFVPESVLWLLADNPLAKENLIKEAVARGIDSTRLIFAERLPIAEHLARHDLANLFLDTLPYNAHTTCSDALWAGLPVLTLKGHTFPGRVAASLLSAVGLSELITNSQEEYAALAIELANNPQKLADIKFKLTSNRLTSPLFNTPLFAKNLEAAYIKMYERYLKGFPPECITI